MGESKGTFCWYELTTTDTRAAERFYCDVVGWGARDAGVADIDYMQFLAGDVPVAGLMALPADASARGATAAWVGSIAVDKVDACADRVIAAGGQVHRAPADIPAVGRFAVVADPQGVTFVLFKAITDTVLPAVTGPGSIGWRELVADDGAEALAFYADLFGWTKVRDFDMGPMGLYHLFAASAGGEAIGGVMTKPPNVSSGFWTYYILVDGIDAAVARLPSAGGTVLNGPHQVPGGLWMVQGRDPQGAMFALLSPQA